MMRSSERAKSYVARYGRDEDEIDEDWPDCSPPCKGQWGMYGARMQTLNAGPYGGRARETSEGGAHLEPPHGALLLHDAHAVGVTARVPDCAECKHDRRRIVGEEMGHEVLETICRLESCLHVDRVRGEIA